MCGSPERLVEAAAECIRCPGKVKHQPIEQDSRNHPTLLAWPLLPSPLCTPGIKMLRLQQSLPLEPRSPQPVCNLYPAPRLKCSCIMNNVYYHDPDFERIWRQIFACMTYASFRGMCEELAAPLSVWTRMTIHLFARDWRMVSGWEWQWSVTHLHLTSQLSGSSDGADILIAGCSFQLN